MAKSPQSKLIIYLIMLLGLIGGYFYYAQIASLSVETEEPPKSELDALKDLAVDFKFLEDGRYKALRTFGEQPVNPGATGKQDLFSAF